MTAIKHKSFRELLEEELGSLGELTMRQRAKRLGLNPAYLSRALSAKIEPQQETVAKFAEGLAQAQNLGREEKDALWARLRAAADGIPVTQAADEIHTLRCRFLDRLRKHPDVTEAYARQTLADTTLDTLLRVVSSEEDLTILPATPNNALRLSGQREEQVLVYGQIARTIPAGPRASIGVVGNMTPAQREQIRSIAELLKLILTQSDQQIAAEPSQTEDVPLPDRLRAFADFVDQRLERFEVLIREARVRDDLRVYDLLKTERAELTGVRIQFRRLFEREL